MPVDQAIADEAIRVAERRGGEVSESVRSSKGWCVWSTGWSAGGGAAVGMCGEAADGGGGVGEGEGGVAGAGGEDGFVGRDGEEEEFEQGKEDCGEGEEEEGEAGGDEEEEVARAAAGLEGIETNITVKYRYKIRTIKLEQ